MTTETETEIHVEYQPDQATVYSVTPRGRLEVAVYGPDTAFGDARPARVNWSAYGSGPPEDAEVYAELLQRAAQVARELRA